MCNKNIDHFFKAITTFSLCCLIAANAVATDTAPTRHGKHDVTRNILRGGGSEKYVKDTLCEGYQYVFGGKKYKETGVYQDTVIENGKEEIYTLDLVVLPPSDTTFISDTNKEGESYQKNGFNITDTEVGTHYYFLDLENKAGCDSVVCLALTTKKAKDPNNGTILFKEDFGGNSVNDPIAKTEGIPQCSYNYNVNPKGGGNYAIRKVGWDHNQWYYPIYDHTYPDDGERGYLMQVDGAGDNGIFYQTQIDGLCANMELYLSIWGMSSTKTSGWNDAELELIVEDLHGNILASKEIVLENQKGYWEQFGLYYVTPQDETSIIYKIKNSSSSSSGNDFMIDDIEVKISTPAVNVPDIKDTLCVGENYSLSATFENDGTYQEPLVYAWYHSDKATYDISDWEFVSYGKELNFSNLKETDAGYYKVWIGSNGTTDINTTCNAASNIIELNVKDCGSACQKDRITLRDTINQGDTYIKNGFSIIGSETGEKEYQQDLVNKQGCDSIVTLYLTVLAPIECNATDTILTETICEGESYSFGGDTYSREGTYSKKYTKICQDGQTADSTVYLKLSVLASSQTSLFDSVAIGENYNKYGFNITASNEINIEYHTQKLQAANGCDSIVTLKLKVVEKTGSNPVQGCVAIDTIIYENICEGETFPFDEDQLTKEGDYTKTFTRICSDGQNADSTVTIRLAVIKPKTETLNDHVFIGHPYRFNGFNIDGSDSVGTFQHILRLQSHEGCDSIVTLNLTVRKEPAELVIPTAFTPYSNDGMNDIFMEGHEVYIYDRYGNLITHSTNGWDGNYKGEPATPGVYVYVLIVEDENGRKEEKGTIEIVKAK